ncbi:MAG TPA: hypothetical protein VGV65_00690, partial [Nocardioides sp.]|nr:hypothetical protein [Nocardioides sp.]
MGLFGRSRGQAGPADDALPFLTVEQADDFRRLFGTALRERGLEVQMHPDHAVDAAERQFGLWNLAAQCADAKRRQWPRLVAEHVDRVLASFDAPDPFDSLTEDGVRRQTYARLSAEDGLPPLDGFPHREFVPGVVEMLALDLPETVAMFNHEHAARLGGWEALREHGVRNLDSLPVEQLETVDLPDGGTFRVLLGDSVHTASRVLLLPGLAALGGQEDRGHGWLMSMPNRHQAAWHMISDATVIPAVQAMAHFARLGHADAPSPISPHVYWWNGS